MIIRNAVGLRGALGGAALCALIASAPRVARADDAPKADAAQGPTAEQLAEQAFKAYEAADFAGAIGLYMKSFQISGDARILYNVASIYDKKLHDRGLAEDFYRRYLKSSTTEPDLVKKANERLTELKNEKETLNDNAGVTAPVKKDTPPAQAAPPPKQEPTSSGFPWKPVGIGVAAVGVVGIGVGTVFGLSALSKADDLKTQCPNNVCASGSGVSLRDDASSAATLSTVFVGAGAALLVGGGLMYFLAPKSGSSTTGLVVVPGLGGVSAHGSF